MTGREVIRYEVAAGRWVLVSEESQAGKIILDEDTSLCSLCRRYFICDWDPDRQGCSCLIT